MCIAIGMRLDGLGQRLDQAAARLGRPSGGVARAQLRCSHLAQRMHFGALSKLERLGQLQRRLQDQLPGVVAQAVAEQRRRMAHAETRLQLLDPSLVLQRGYAWLSDRDGHALTSVRQLSPGDTVRARVADGQAELNVLDVEPKSRPGTTRRANE